MAKFKYVYKNVNPAKHEVGDCVIRAIACATDTPWMDVFDELTRRARENFSMPNYKDVYQPYLDEKYPRIPVMHKVSGKNKRHTARTLAKVDPKGVYILRCANHLTVLYENDCYDLWDASDCASYIIWKIR